MLQKKSNYIMSLEANQWRIFNDYPLYESLRQAQDCKSVKIVSVRVQHNGKFTQGLQVTYKSTFMDGSVLLTKGGEHIFRQEGNPYAAGDIETDCLTLGPDEYIVSIKPKQAIIVDGITFVTNQREVHCGGTRGYWLKVEEATSLSFPPPTKDDDDVKKPYSSSSGMIVAFAGTARGILQRIGFFYDSPDDEDKVHFYYSGTRPHRHNTEWSRNHREVIRQARTMLQLDSFDDYFFIRNVYPGLSGMDITRIAVYHTETYCRGLEATYRVYFPNRNAIRMRGGRHFLILKRGVQEELVQRTELVMIRGEYLVGTRLYKITGKIVGITFVTNFREFHCGAQHDIPTECFPSDTSPPSKVIAFAGAFNDYLTHLGYYASSLEWERSRPLIIARWQLKSGTTRSGVANPNAEQMSIYRMLTLPDGPFKKIIKYRSQIG